VSEIGADRTCVVYRTALGVVRLTEAVADDFPRLFREERARFHDNLMAWLETATDKGASLDRIVIRLSQYRKWTGR
jgi:hypothetical protein